MKAGEILGSYVLETELGRGPSASTWLARSSAGAGDSPRVVLKILDLSEASTWGAVDIFRRECEALKRLEHPAIPRYLENFEAEADGKLRLVLAMERIEGRNLEAAIASGKRFSETEVEDILAQLSEILAYLGSLRPPLVHRDINPKNIILRPGGVVSLVDFSGVQDAVAAALYPGATMVGTAGYMPLEQVAGRASHRSDLYGAAATALFLLTARNPAELPTKALKVDLSGIMDLSPRLDAVLSSWLEPDVERRNLGAAEAASILRGETRVETTSRREAERSRAPAGAVPHAAASHTAAPSNRKQPGMARTLAPLPADSRLEVEESLDGIRVFFPRTKPRISSAPIAGFAVFWLAFVAFWTMMTLRMRAPLFFPFFSIPFWGVGIAMARAAFGAVFTSRELILDGDGLRIRTKGLGMEKAESWPLADLGEVKVQPSRFQVQGSSTNELLLEAGTRKISIGSGLSDRELLFLEDKLGDTIERLRGT